MKIKSEKGSITLFVLIAMLFFIIYLVSLYIITANAESATLASTKRIKEIYEQNINNIDDVYQTLIKKDNEKYNGYISDGLVAYYDLSQTKSIQGSKLIDLSENGNDGTINGAILKNGALQFDGIDDWVAIKEFNYENVTLEAVVEYDEIPDTSEMSIVSNFETGGYALSNYAQTGITNFNKFTINLDGTYYSSASNEEIITNNKYFLSGSYNGNTIKLVENGVTNQIQQTGTVKNPNANTIMVLGANPYKDTAGGSFIKGKIYAIRIYNRALTDEEIAQNYKIDLKRFQD